jgi:hypothetical protein
MPENDQMVFPLGNAEGRKTATAVVISGYTCYPETVS